MRQPTGPRGEGIPVHPEWQHGGVGRLPVSAAEDYARQHDVQTIRLEALAANRRLTAWYARLGYVRCGSRRHSGFEFDVFQRVL
jgi:ribosomal protein S18 acetylase RimI-like enzyme